MLNLFDDEAYHLGTFVTELSLLRVPINPVRHDAIDFSPGLPGSRYGPTSGM